MLDNMKDKTFLLKCTVRYCLGRRSYAVGWIHDLLVKHWDEIPRNDRKSILEDIRGYMNAKNGINFDRMIWDEILELGYKDNLIVRK